jgi:Nucleotidyl transferase AbiEii toxin, Type IV TA system
VIAKETLKRKVERLLQSPLVTASLRARGVEIGEVSATKQTMTTQRWKLALRSGSSVAFRTKLEFSRRDEVERTEFAAVDAAVLRPYGLTPFLATHYTTAAAIEQKIKALAGRTEPQARDVFDLNLLFARPEATHELLSAACKSAIPAAIDRALGLSFDEYRATVVAYLDPQQSAPYEGRAAWEAMQSAVLTKLEALA